jgi:hypothetical protein
MFKRRNAALPVLAVAQRALRDGAMGPWNVYLGLLELEKRRERRTCSV